jgi:hypothetical protein
MDDEKRKAVEVYVNIRAILHIYITGMWAG